MSLESIAKIAQVSKTTVSLALNGKQGVSSKTRKRILAIANEMNYRIPQREAPNQRTITIQFLKLTKHGEILNKDLNIFIADYIDGISHVAKEMGYICEVRSHTTEEIDVFTEEAVQQQIQGMIVLGTELLPDEVESLKRLPIPFVVIDTNYDFIPVDFVNMNNAAAVNEIVAHFTSAGHSNIGIVTSSIPSGNVMLRERAFFEAMKRQKLSVDQRKIFRARPDFQHAYEDMLKYLNKDSTLPGALFCCNDIIACGCIKALKEHGINVPDDVSIIGFDDLSISSMMDPKLTTIRVCQKKIGTMAMKLLAEKINSLEEQHPVHVQVNGTLIVKDSVKNLKGR